MMRIVLTKQVKFPVSPTRNYSSRMHHQLEDIKIDPWLVSKVASPSCKRFLNSWRRCIQGPGEGYTFFGDRSRAYTLADTQTVSGNRHTYVSLTTWRAASARPSPFPRRTRFNAVCIRERSRFSMQRSISFPLSRVAKWFNNEQSDQDSRSRPRPMHFTIARACTADVDDGRMSLIGGHFLRTRAGLFD